MDSIELPANSSTTISLGVPLDQSLLRIGPLSESGMAVAIRARQNERVVTPRTQQVLHRLGKGIRLRIQGESLLRVRTHDGSAVTVRLGNTSLRSK